MVRVASRVSLKRWLSRYLGGYISLIYHNGRRLDCQLLNYDLEAGFLLVLKLGRPGAQAKRVRLSELKHLTGLCRGL